jgi:hypothetical protein
MRMIAIGAWISLPGSPAASASGTRPSPAQIAVIRIGARRWRAAVATASRSSRSSASTSAGACSVSHALQRSTSMPARMSSITSRRSFGRGERSFR